MATRLPFARRGDREHDPEGRMTLGEHLRELRNRLFVAVIALVVGIIIAWFFYTPILRILTTPFCELTRNGGGFGIVPGSHAANPDGAACPLFFNTIFSPFLFRLKISALVAAIGTSPIWLGQLWGFITPGLRRHEKSWTVAFVAIAVPLFLAGAVLAYTVMSKGLQILLSFVPTGFGTLITFDHYMQYFTAMVLIFGAGFELPLLVVLLNFAGVLTFERLKQWQRRAIVLIFVFAAVATPSQDPFSMLALGIPILILFEVAVVIAYFHDKRKGVGGAVEEYEELDDDETSPLEMDRTDL